MEVDLATIRKIKEAFEIALEVIVRGSLVIVELKSPEYQQGFAEGVGLIKKIVLDSLQKFEEVADDTEV